MFTEKTPTQCSWSYVVPSNRSLFQALMAFFLYIFISIVNFK